MTTYPVPKAEVPKDSFLSDCLPRFDFADAYSSSISDEQALGIDDLASASLLRVPQWIGIRRRVRNLLARPMGLETGYDPKAGSGCDRCMLQQLVRNRLLNTNRPDFWIHRIAKAFTLPQTQTLT